MAKSSVLQLLNQHMQQMIEHAKNDAEREVCGLIAGHWRPFDKLAIAVRVEGITNAARDQRYQYRMDEREQVRVMSMFGQEGMELVGIYHSHPQGPAQPSSTDIGEATYPDAIYLILAPDNPQTDVANSYHVSTEGYRVSAWRIKGGEAFAAKIQVMREE